MKLRKCEVCQMTDVIEDTFEAHLDPDNSPVAKVCAYCSIIGADEALGLSDLYYMGAFYVGLIRMFARAYRNIMRKLDALS